MIRFPLHFASLLIVPTLLSGITSACTCATTVLNLNTLHKADAVFSGKAIKIEQNQERLQTTATFQVDRIWKGMLGKQVCVTTDISGAACGYEFELGRKYLIYGYRNFGTLNLRTGLCTHTKPFERSAKDQELFGVGYEPSDIVRFAEKISGSSGLYLSGHPILFRMTYRNGIESWRGSVKVEDGWPEPEGNTFLRIERCPPPSPEEAVERELMERVEAKIDKVAANEKLSDFEVIADLNRSHHMELPGKYLVMWGCRLPSGFEVTHTSVIEVMHLEDAYRSPAYKESTPSDPVPGSKRNRPMNMLHKSESDP